MLRWGQPVPVPMRLDSLKRCALSLPQATLVRQWGDNLVGKIAGKIFCIFSLDGELLERVSFKVSPSEFRRLTDLDGIIPAPYLARASWVSVEDFAALPSAELEAAVRTSYALVVAALPKKTQATLKLPVNAVPSPLKNPGSPR